MGMTGMTGQHGDHRGVGTTCGGDNGDHSHGGVGTTWRPSGDDGDNMGMMLG